MSERSLWRLTIDRIGPYGRFERVENRVNKGTPDVNYTMRGVSGWLELKFTSIPSRDTTPIIVSSLTLEQVQWHEAWAKAGGRTWTLLQAGRGYCLLTPYNLRRLYEGHYDKHSLPKAARVYSYGKFPAVEIIKCLSETSQSER